MQSIRDIYSQVLKSVAEINSTLDCRLAEDFFKDQELRNFEQFLLTNIQIYAEEGHQLSLVLIKNSLEPSNDLHRARWLNLSKENRTTFKTTAIHNRQTSHFIQRDRSLLAQIFGNVFTIESNFTGERDFEALMGLFNTSSPEFQHFLLDIIAVYCANNCNYLTREQTRLMFGCIEAGLNNSQPAVVESAIRALTHSLSHLQSAKELREVFLAHVCNHLRSGGTLSNAAFCCFTEAVQHQYSNLKMFLNLLIQAFFECVRVSDPLVLMSAVELITTLAEKEQQHIVEPQPCIVIQSHSAAFFEVLTHLMTRQSEVQTEQTWNESMAAATCLRAIASYCPLLEPALAILERDYCSNDWRQREASLMTLAMCIEGAAKRNDLTAALRAKPKLEEILIYSVICAGGECQGLLADTALWTLAKVAEVCPGLFSSPHYLLTVLLEIIAKKVREACAQSTPLSTLVGRCYLAIQNLASPMRPSLTSDQHRDVMEVLIKRTIECPQRSGVIALRAWIEKAPQHYLRNLADFSEGFTRLLATEFAAEKTRYLEVQDLFCELLQVLSQRLPSVFADEWLSHYFKLMGTNGYPLAQEEALRGLCDLFEFHFPQVEKHAVTCLDHVFAILKVGNRGLLPCAMSLVSTIAVTIGQRIESRLPLVWNFLIDMMNYNDEDLDFMNIVRQYLLDAFSHLITGLRTDGKSYLILQIAPSILQYTGKIFEKLDRSEVVLQAAMKVLEDILLTWLNRNHDEALGQNFSRAWLAEIDKGVQDMLNTYQNNKLLLASINPKLVDLLFYRSHRRVVHDVLDDMTGETKTHKVQKTLL